MMDGVYAILCTSEDGAQLRRGKLYLRRGNGELRGVMCPVTDFWLDAPFHGGVSRGEEFTFTVFWNTPCRQLAMEVTGRVEGDILTGRATSSSGSWTLTGRRVAG